MNPMMMGRMAAQNAPLIAQRQQDTFLTNLGKFAMMAGTGAVSGIGAGLANIDLNNPFRGAGMAVLGGTQPGAAATSEMMAADQRKRAVKQEIEAEEEVEAAREERAKKRAASDAQSFRPSLKGTKGGRPRTEVDLRLGTGGLDSYGKLFLAQRGLDAAQQTMQSQRAREIMLGIKPGGQ
jgi:hypothetical protein